MLFDFTLLVDSGRKLLDTFVAWLPRLIVAVIAVCIAILMARAARWAVERALSPNVPDLKRRFTDLLGEGIDGVSQDPRAEVLTLTVAGDRSATLRLRWWSDSERGEYLIVRDRVLDRVWQILDSNRAPAS